MKILAIDPGYERLGIAVIEKEPRGKEMLIYSDCFKTSAKLPHPERLKLIHQEIKRVITEYIPERMAIETLFFSTNQKTALLVAEARGVIIAAGATAGLEIFEFNPNSIKLAVTGSGASDKDQIIKMIPLLVKIQKEIKHDDEYDAIACGLTYFAEHPVR
ncbi:MAG: crossover junction endodeoxyribonuclease RuvC, crossover junction endodeoxyribonuclease RuvC [Candidatus Parcubacteria bacterium]|jgi:crossover junction endodeoxyribonuclease RuvC